MIHYRYINEEEVAHELGYRNFVSLISILYYKEKRPLIYIQKETGLSKSKIRSEMVKRGFKLRRRGLLPGVSPDNKRKINIEAIIKNKTDFIFPWCAIYSFYNKNLMTGGEIADLLGISSFVVYKLMKKYGIKVRCRMRKE